MYIFRVEVRWTSFYDTEPVPVPTGHPTDYVQLFYAPVGTPGPVYLYGTPVLDWAASHPGWTAGPSTRLSATEPGIFDGGSVWRGWSTTTGSS